MGSIDLSKYNFIGKSYPQSNNARSGDFDDTIPFKCFCAIDLRRFLPTIEEDFCAYFTFILAADNATGDRSVWGLARSIKSQIDTIFQLGTTAELVKNLTPIEFVKIP